MGIYENNIESLRTEIYTLEEQIAGYGSISAPAYLKSELNGKKETFLLLEIAKTLKDKFERVLFHEKISIGNIVPLELKSGSITENSVTNSKDNTAIPVVDKSAPPTTLGKFLNEHKRVTLLGEPGSGKTTLLLDYALELIREYLEDPNLEKRKRSSTFIPLYIQLSYWTEGTLQEFLFSEFCKLLPLETFLEFSRAKFGSFLIRGEFVLLLDGLNELPSSTITQDDSRIEEVNKIRENYNNEIKCVVSCRRKDFKYYTNWHDLHILEMNRPLLENFAKEYFSKRKATYEERDKIQKKFLKELYSNMGDGHQMQVRKLAFRPFFLLAILEDYLETEKINSNQANLLKGIVNREFAKVNNYDENLKSKTRGFLAALACFMSYVNIQNIEADQILLFLERFFKDLGLVIEENSIQIWLEIAGKTNLISRSDRKILFRHQLIKEYFAASYCNQLINSRDFPPTEMVQEHLAEIWRLWFFDNQTILDKLLILLTNAQVDMTIKQDVAMALVFIGTEVTEPLMRGLDFVNRKFSEHKASIDRLKLQIEYFASEIRKEEEEKSSPDLDKIINWEKEQKTTALAMEEMGKESGILNQIRTLIAEILGEIGDEKVLPELNNLINIASQNETQQKLTLAALIAVKKIASPDSRVLLHNLLKTTEEKDLRLEAIEALGEVGNETTIELFREIILQNTYRGEEEADKILEALQKIWEEKTVDYSKKILSEVGEPAIDTLIKLFTNRRERDMTIRIALSTLGEIGQATHIEHIENYYTDFEPKTRKVAKEAIGKIKDRIAN